jgi:hypothetical protein
VFLLRIEAETSAKSQHASDRAEMLKEWKKMSETQAVARKVQHGLSI